MTDTTQCNRNSQPDASTPVVPVLDDFARTDNPEGAFALGTRFRVVGMDIKVMNGNWEVIGLGSGRANPIFETRRLGKSGIKLSATAGNRRLWNAAQLRRMMTSREMGGSGTLVVTSTPQYGSEVAAPDHLQPESGRLTGDRARVLWTSLCHTLSLASSAIRDISQGRASGWGDRGPLYLQALSDLVSMIVGDECPGHWTIVVLTDLSDGWAVADLERGVSTPWTNSSVTSDVPSLVRMLVKHEHALRAGTLESLDFLTRPNPWDSALALVTVEGALVLQKL